MSNTNDGLRLRLLEYWISWAARGFASGKWDSVYLGRGYDLQGTAPFREDPDLVRINWQATKLTGEIQVNQFSEERNADIYFVANLSPSMAFGSNMTKLDRVAVLAAVMAFSAEKAKDSFRFMAYTQDIERRFPTPGDKSYPFRLGRAIMNFDWRGKKKGGLTKAALMVQQSKSLVMIVSDFLGSPEVIDRSLRILATNHEVMPIVLWDSLEVELPGKGWGFVPLQDLETGELSYVFLTDRIREKYRQQCLARRGALEKIFARYGIKPLFMIGDLQSNDMEKLMRAFLSKRNKV